MVTPEIEKLLNEIRDLTVKRTVNVIGLKHFQGIDNAANQYEWLEDGYRQMHRRMKDYVSEDEFADYDTQVWMETCDIIQERNTQRLLLQVEMLADMYEHCCCDGPIGEDLADLTIKTAQSLAKGIKEIRKKHKKFFKYACIDFEEYDSKNTPKEMYPYID